MSQDLLPDDPQLVENILAEVKKTGLFDQFRRDCIDEVDTKPAYLNLKLRVESTVSNFLNRQMWSPDLNRNQLRDRLRRTITESSYLDRGIDQIVEQVMNPKRGMFVSKVEELVYRYLGIEAPKSRAPNGKMDFCSVLPNDLEAVSSPENEPPEEVKKEESETVNEDFESPAFEPLEGLQKLEAKEESPDSNLSGISGLTSHGSGEAAATSTAVAVAAKEVATPVPPPVKMEEGSQLSQVSSDSRLSIVIDEGSTTSKPEPEVLNINEEAQMPKFNDNSNSVEPKVTIVEEQRVINFDFKKEEIEFIGTERKSLTLDEKLKDEIFQSEQKQQSGVFKMEEETCTQGSETKLEIVEHSENKTESCLEHPPQPLAAPEVKKESPKEAVVKSEEAKKSSSSSKEKDKHSHRSHSSKHSSSSRDRRDDRRHSEKDIKKPSTSSSGVKHSSSSGHHSSSRHKSSHSSSSDRHRSSDKDKDKQSSDSSRRHESSSRSKSRHKDRHRESDRPKRPSDEHSSSRSKEVKKRRSSDSNDEKQAPALPPPPPEPPKEESVPLPPPPPPPPLPEETKEIKMDIALLPDDFHGFDEAEVVEMPTALKHFQSIFATREKTPPLPPSPLQPIDSKFSRSLEEEEFLGFAESPLKRAEEKFKKLPRIPKLKSPVVVEKPTAEKPAEPKTPQLVASKRLRKPSNKYSSSEFASIDDDALLDQLKKADEEAVKATPVQKKLKQLPPTTTSEAVVEGKEKGSDEERAREGVELKKKSESKEESTSKESNPPKFEGLPRSKRSSTYYTDPSDLYKPRPSIPRSRRRGHDSSSSGNGDGKAQ